MTPRLVAAIAVGVTAVVLSGGMVYLFANEMRAAAITCLVALTMALLTLNGVGEREG